MNVIAGLDTFSLCLLHTKILINDLLRERRRWSNRIFRYRSLLFSDNHEIVQRQEGHLRKFDPIILLFVMIRSVAFPVWLVDYIDKEIALCC